MPWNILYCTQSMQNAIHLKSFTFYFRIFFSRRTRKKISCMCSIVITLNMKWISDSVPSHGVSWCMKRNDRLYTPPVVKHDRVIYDRITVIIKWLKDISNKSMYSKITGDISKLLWLSFITLEIYLDTAEMSLYIPIHKGLKYKLSSQKSVEG